MADVVSGFDESSTKIISGSSIANVTSMMAVEGGWASSAAAQKML